MTTVLVTLSIAIAMAGLLAHHKLQAKRHIIGAIAVNLFLNFIAFLQWKPVLPTAALLAGYYLGPFPEQKKELHLTWLSAFLFLFCFKFVRIVVHIISYLLYKPAVMAKNPKFAAKDVTVVIPSFGDFDAHFDFCLGTILRNFPAEVIISTVGEDKFQLASRVCKKYASQGLRVIQTDEPNKRKQFAAGVDAAKTSIVACVDDSAFWGNEFLQNALIPFEDAKVGLVGTVKRVTREKSDRPFSFALWKEEVRTHWIGDILNFIAVLYLERHNWECTATENIDGGVFVISGRTQFMFRSLFLKLKPGFLTETWLFGTVVLDNADDDCHVTRWMVNNGYKCVFHNSPKALMHTRLGVIDGWTKFGGQCTRWVKSTLRSNSTSLFADRTVWTTQPWCTYAIHMTSLVNYAFFYDLALYLTLWFSPYGSAQNILRLAMVIFASKMYKIIPYYSRNPIDLWYIPVQIGFGYYHSYIKLKALFDPKNASWGTRAGVK